VDPRSGLDDVEKKNFLTLLGLELRLLGRPASNQLLYLLSYPGSSFTLCLTQNYFSFVNCVIFSSLKGNYELFIDIFSFYLNH
jgi:hypothetical protein